MNEQHKPSAAERLIEALLSQTLAQRELTDAIRAQTAEVARLVSAMADDVDDVDHEPAHPTYLSGAPRT